MARPVRDIVLIGGSAGAIVAVQTIVRALPGHFAGSVCIVLHRHQHSPLPHWLAEEVSRYTAIPTGSAYDGQPIEPGHVYVAPIGQHMVLGNGLVRLEPSPPEHFSRPCIDVLFKSGAMQYGRRVVGILLSGATGTDGPAGLWQIRHRGGITIVQDPANAKFAAMPPSGNRERCRRLRAAGHADRSEAGRARLLTR